MPKDLDRCHEITGEDDYGDDAYCPSVATWVITVPNGTRTLTTYRCDDCLSKLRRRFDRYHVEYGIEPIRMNANER